MRLVTVNTENIGIITKYIDSMKTTCHYSSNLDNPVEGWTPYREGSKWAARTARTTAAARTPRVSATAATPTLGPAGRSPVTRATATSRRLDSRSVAAARRWDRYCSGQVRATCRTAARRSASRRLLDPGHFSSRSGPGHHYFCILKSSWFTQNYTN